MPFAIIADDNLKRREIASKLTLASRIVRSQQCRSHTYRTETNIRQLLLLSNSPPPLWLSAAAALSLSISGYFLLFVMCARCMVERFGSENRFFFLFILLLLCELKATTTQTTATKTTTTTVSSYRRRINDWPAQNTHTNFSVVVDTILSPCFYVCLCLCVSSQRRK